MSAFENFIQLELPKRPYTELDTAQETVLVRRGPGPRQHVGVALAEGQVLGMQGGELVGMSNAALGTFVLAVPVPSMVWTVSHNLGSEDVIVQAFDTNKEVVLPDTIKILDANTVELTFNTALAGAAHAISLAYGSGGGGGGGGSGDYVALTGDTMTGQLSINATGTALSVVGKSVLANVDLTGPYTESRVLVTTDTTTTLDLSASNNFVITMTQDTLLSFTNVGPPTLLQNITLFIVQDSTGSHLITWPPSVKWPGGVPPTLTATMNYTDVITLASYNGGTTWIGFVAGQNYPA